VTALAWLVINFTDKLQTRPLVREGASQEETRKSLKILYTEVKEKVKFAVFRDDATCVL
jgi:hypothetical protein